MSRIHEALKKAEQERAMSQPSGPVESVPAALFEATPPVPAQAMSAAAEMRPIVDVRHLEETVLARSRRTQWNPDAGTMLFFRGEEHAVGMEEFRTLRSRLYQTREQQSSLSTILVTSALPKEGKSFTAANLAQVIVRQHGKRALLIDGDLRNPQLHSALGTEPSPGLSEYLQSQVDEFSILQRGPMENLFFIPGGGMNQSPAELVANGRMKWLLNRLQPMFDWIIVDSPPAALVSDAALLANYCDGVLLVVRSNGTPVDAARRARREFAGHRLVGVVLNGVAPELSPSTRYYYLGYGQDRKTQKEN